MLLSLLAGIFNGIGTIILKASNNRIPLIILALFFYGINFIFFRGALKYLDPKNAYIFLVISSLLFLKFYELIRGNSYFEFKDFFGIILFIGSFYLLNK